MFPSFARQKFCFIASCIHANERSRVHTGQYCFAKRARELMFSSTKQNTLYCIHLSKFIFFLFRYRHTGCLGCEMNVKTQDTYNMKMNAYEKQWERVSERERERVIQHMCILTKISPIHVTGLLGCCRCYCCYCCVPCRQSQQRQYILHFCKRPKMLCATTIFNPKDGTIW